MQSGLPSWAFLELRQICFASQMEGSQTQNRLWDSRAPGLGAGVLDSSFSSTMAGDRQSKHECDPYNVLGPTGIGQVSGTHVVVISPPLGVCESSGNMDPGTC